MTSFLFATGIENSSPTILGPDGRTLRIDEMAKCGHYDRWREDFALTKELGCGALRYGPPYYRTHLGPGRYDWAFADATFAALRDLDLLPIVDLCHFGVPDWLGDFQNPDWPQLFAEYARAFATRFPWVRLYTPVNEIFVAATFSAQYGWWNERLASDRAFVTALKHLCMANVLAMRAILEVTPDAVFIQSESSEAFHPEDPACLEHARFLNEKRFLALDLTYGRPLGVRLYEYLLDNGMTRAEYHWFGDHQVKSRCVMGNDYYATNEHLVHDDGTFTPSGEIFGYYVITREYYDRYKLPVMHTETNRWDPDAVQWLWKEWSNLYRLKRDGVPILGFTWYSLTDQMDWDTALLQDNHVVNPVGCYDLDRRRRAVGHAYQRLIEQWQAVLPTESSALTVSF